MTRSLLSMLFGLLLLGLGTERVTDLVTPGPLTSAHAAIEDCSACHTTPHSSPARWLDAALSGAAAPQEGSACLTCHDVGQVPEAPHGIARADLPAPSVKPRDGGPRTTEIAHRLLQPAADQLACSSCHREHAGRHAELASLSNDQCQVCHSVRFATLADGHPKFDGYPYHRRTRINFDHATHLGKHFAKERAVAPESCDSCHRPEQQGRVMLAGSFERTCAACHAADIDGSKLAGPRGIAMVEVPGIDLATLRERGIDIGNWPEFAEAPLTPLTKLLLDGDPDFRRVRDNVGVLDMLDLEQASPSQLEAVAALAWAFKRTVDELGQVGPGFFLQRLSDALASEQALSEADARELAGRMPVAVLEAAVVNWFPDLSDELAAHAQGRAPPTRAIRPNATESTSPALAAAPDDEDAQAFDDLFGGELLGAADEVDSPATGADPASSRPVDHDTFDSLFGEGLLDAGATATRQALPSADHSEHSMNVLVATPQTREERMFLGGWYRDDLTVRYRPAGHDDDFMRAWLDLAAANNALEPLLDEGVPGSCTKCHGVSRSDGIQKVDWTGQRPRTEERPFTVFSHSKHFSMAGDAGCRSCHVLAPDADYQAAFTQRDPTRFASNFGPLERSTCASCHNAQQAGESCVSCHRYHAGTRAAKLPTISTSVGAPALPAD